MVSIHMRTQHQASNTNKIPFIILKLYGLFS